MNSSILFLAELIMLVGLTGLLVTLYGVRRAPVGFQHLNLFYYGTPPVGLVVVESEESAAPRSASWQ